MDCKVRVHRQAPARRDAALKRYRRRRVFPDAAGQRAGPAHLLVGCLHLVQAVRAVLEQVGYLAHIFLGVAVATAAATGGVGAAAAQVAQNGLVQACVCVVVVGWAVVSTHREKHEQGKQRGRQKNGGQPWNRHGPRRTPTPLLPCRLCTGGLAPRTDRLTHSPYLRDEIWNTFSSSAAHTHKVSPAAVGDGSSSGGGRWRRRQRRRAATGSASRLADPMPHHPWHQLHRRGATQAAP